MTSDTQLLEENCHLRMVNHLQGLKLDRLWNERDNDKKRIELLEVAIVDMLKRLPTESEKRYLTKAAHV